MSKYICYKRLAFFSFLMALSVSSVFAQAKDTLDPLALPPEEFFNLDLGVVSPAKKLQKLKNVPSAVYVLTEEDIQRSAATTLPDVLRLVPGLNVAQVSSNKWAITSRGFNQVYANNILMLIDGVPVETLIFNGVFWENINLPLDSIQRIEVMRGPGAAVWGMRAVNGVINIITKSAYSVPQSKASLGVGDEHRTSATLRTGSVISPNAAILGNIKYDQHDSSRGPNGENLNDQWNIVSTSLRGDFRPDSRTNLRTTSYLSAKKEDYEVIVPTLNEPFHARLADRRDHYLASQGLMFEREVSPFSIFSAEISTAYENRRDILLDYSSWNSEVELRHRLNFERHDFAYGTNLRFYSDATDGSNTLSFVPEDRSLEFYRGFVHDEIEIAADMIWLTLGSRFEQNSQNSFSALPTARLLWKVNNDLSFWSAVSRTSGTPSRVNDDIRLNALSMRDLESGLPTVIRVTGDRSVDSEKLMAYEVGAWFEPFEDAYVSLTGYFFNYDDVISRELGVPFLDNSNPSTPFIVAPLQYRNGLEAKSSGIEFSFDYSLSKKYSLAASYAYLDIDAVRGTSQDSVAFDFIENVPKHTATTTFHSSLSQDLESDIVLRYVDKLSRSLIDSYIELDFQMRWFLTSRFDLSLIGRNLLNGKHEEFKAITFQAPVSSIERSFFLQAAYSF